MGIALWMICGVAAFAVSRAIAAARANAFAAEAVAAVVVAFAAGVASTALDFGGWNEFDWRAGAFALCGAFAAVGCVRIVRLARRSVA